MNKVLILVTLLIVSSRYVSAQQYRYDVALSAGFYQAPDYKRAQSKQFLAADFDYHLSERWTISSGFMSGQFAYYEDYRNNITWYGDPYRNADGYESHTYLTAGYSLIHNRKFYIQLGTGVGLFTQRLKYPYQEPSSGGSPRGYGGNIFTAEESFTIVELPLKVEGFYMLGTRVGLGVRAGTFVQIGRPLAGTYIGPQVRIRL